jgi:hypothetical protein
MTLIMPGFTAEMGLFDAQSQYQAVEEAVADSARVQLAARPDLGLPCLKFHFVCRHGSCHWVTTVGHVTAGGCE